LEFETLESRTVLSAAGIVDPLAATVDVEQVSVAGVAPIDTPITSLNFHSFELLTPAQIPLLLPSQVATIPDAYWLGRIPAASRAAFTAPQIQALRVSAMRISLLTPQQVNWLTPNHIRSLTHFEFEYLSPAQIPTLTTAQIASIPDSGTFTEWSAAARAALTVPQVQALRVATVRLHLLTPTQVGWLTTSQIQSLDHFDFKYLAAHQTPLLTLGQVASIPDIGSFGAWSAAARGSLTPAQVQALRVAEVRLQLLTPTQVSWLSGGQIQSLRYYDFPYLSAAQTPLLTAAQLASIPSIGSFGEMSSSARAALTLPQVQALNVGAVYIQLLTAQQTGWLTAAQVRALPQHQFHYLPATHTPLLTAAQVASIPTIGSFGSWSAAARAALTVGQVQALNVDDVRLILLTPAQASWLTASQIRSLYYYDFHLLNAAQTPLLTTAQIATIPSIGSFGAWSAAARAALTLPQVQALNVSSVYIQLLTAQQTGWLTATQVRTLPEDQFRYLPASQTPWLTLAQVASISSFGAFNEWSPAARAALTPPQVQSLHVSALGLELLTAQQIGWLTPAQIQILPYQQFRYLHPGQIPALTTAQIASMQDVGPFAIWSNEARAALSYVQVRSLPTDVLRLDLLTPTQIRWLTTEQVQSRSSTELVMLHESQIPLLTNVQMAALPEDYNIRLWSDEQQAALTRVQLLALPYPVLQTLNGLFPDMTPPTNYMPAVLGHNHGAHEAEAAPVLNLVPIAAATHRTIASGNWSNPGIWSGGVVPGANARVLISEGTNVRFDLVMNAAIFTLRIDGKLEFATNINTQLKVDTIVVNDTGALHIGTDVNPIADHVTAKVLIAANGPINSTWDPFSWSRGLVSRGEVRINGRNTTPYATLAINPRAGNTLLYFTEPPAGWRVGDEIAIAGTHAYTLDFNTDRVRIRSINGSVVEVDPLRYNHDMPGGLGLSLYVANLTRNVQFLSENPDVPALQRPHIALIHNPDVRIDGAGIYDFGRTDKALPINSPVVVGGVVQPGTGTNPRARYALHFHHMGVDSRTKPALVFNSVVDGSPGWGFVNHSSYVVMGGNVAFGVKGAAFVTEDGNEVGLMHSNLAMNTVGSLTTENILSRHANHDFGYEGNGFWFQGPGVEVINNISTGSHDAGFVYLPQSSKTLFDAINMKDPSLAAGHLAVPVGTVPLATFSGNKSYNAEFGLEIWHLGMLMTDGVTEIDRFTSWNTTQGGIDLHYVGHVTFNDVRLYGDLTQFVGTGVRSNRLTHDITFNNLTAVGFEVGIDVPVRRHTQINGGLIYAVQGLYIEKGHDTIRTVTAGGGLLLIKPTAAQLRGRTYYDVYATAHHSFEYPYFADRRIDSMFSDDVISISINGAAPGRLYFYEQSPHYVVFPASTSTSDVPAGYLNKTNAQLSAEFGLAVNGELLPTSVVQLPEVYGLMRYRF
jgi:hypothetical protein